MNEDDEVVMVCGRPMFYDRQGKPCTRGFWREKVNDIAYCVVKQEMVGGLRVSTVWLGLDYGLGHMLGADVPPVIFETMCFPGNACRRWATEAQALAGHEEVVADIKNAIGLEGA